MIFIGLEITTLQLPDMTMETLGYTRVIKWNTNLPSSHQGESELEPEMKLLKGKLHGSFETLWRGYIKITSDEI